MNPSTRLLTLVLGFAAATELVAANWPHWRGPNYDGSSPEKNLPVNFSRTNNVAWVTPLPGPSAATPVIWGDHVFVSSTDRQSNSLRALALDRKSGRILWNAAVAEGYRQDDRSTLASPSPVTDGQRVFFYYGNGDLAAFDFAGKKLWARQLGPFAFLWTYSTSPTLHDGKLLIQVLQRDEPVRGRGHAPGDNDSYLLALDPATGQELWRHIRPSDAVMESREAFTTPIPCRHAGRDVIVVAGGDCITGHDPQDGAELWRWGTWNPGRIGHWRLVPSPVAGEGMALAAVPKGGAIYAVKFGGQGKLDDSWIAWKTGEREISTDVSTPAYYQGRFYVLNSDKRIIARVDPATGKADWVGDLGTRLKLEASPTVADGKIYVQNFRGEVFIVAADREFKLLNTIAMGDPEDNDNRASVAVAQGNLFLRTGSRLYCIGAPAASATK
jgi:outer membrane protein assembly factor BamB